jgi:hypothetical protein
VAEGVEVGAGFKVLEDEKLLVAAKELFAA